MERIGNEVQRELARSGGEAVPALAGLTAAWPRAVGETIARQAWPLRLGRDGTLHVATSSATWAFELDRMSAEIVGRLAAEMGDSAPTALRFRVGPVPESATLPEVQKEPSERQLEDTAKTSAEAAEIASEIDDPELRDLVARAARASLGKARSGRGF
jgi:predicted nucleic acid-binding Zn ribbon protein